MYQLHNGDCVDVMSLMPDCSIDLTVTSPPYDDMRTYNGTLNWNHGVFCSVANQLYRVTKDGGVVVWVVADATVNGSETGTSFRHALYFQEIGFNIHDTMIWLKPSFNATGDLQVRYAQVFEYMFVFSKGKPKSFDPIKDRANKNAGKAMHGTKRHPNGSMKPISSQGKIISEYGQRFNVWDVGNLLSKGERTGHPAQFPETLASDHIRSWSAEGDTVLDPFMGSGTTGVACAKTGRNFVGIEKERGYFEISDRRVSEAHKEPKQELLF